MPKIDRLHGRDTARSERQAVQTHAARPVLGRSRARHLGTNEGKRRCPDRRTDESNRSALGSADVRRPTGLLALGAAGASLLQACAPAPPARGSTPAAAGRADAGRRRRRRGSNCRPTCPSRAPSPTSPGNAHGLDPAYFKFPTDLAKTVTSPPGDGSTITAITYLTLAPPPPMEPNAAWQAVNKAINATLRMDQVTAADYPAKVNVVVAGNDLPGLHLQPDHQRPVGRHRRAARVRQGQVRRPDALSERRRDQGIPESGALHQLHLALGRRRRQDLRACRSRGHRSAR